MLNPTGIDLKPFCLCLPDEHASYNQEVKQLLSAPFSIGDHTYATNGHICVRIPRRLDAPEVKETPDTTKLLSLAPKLFLDSVGYYQLAPLNLPEVEERTCGACRGRGTKHDCPSCTCPCPHCDNGKSIWEVFVRIGSATFQANYVRLMLALPGLQVSKTLKRHVSAQGPARPLRFCFDGGEGALMSANAKASITARFMRASGKAIAP
jgi:hypothetical protein